MEQPSQAPPQN
jgi:hypothetical protein